MYKRQVTDIPLIDKVDSREFKKFGNNTIVPLGGIDYFKDIVSVKYQDADDNLLDYTLPAIKEALDLPKTFNIVQKTEGQTAPYTLFRIVLLRGSYYLFPPVTGWETDSIQVNVKTGVEPTGEYDAISQAVGVVCRELYSGGNVNKYREKYRILIDKFQNMDI